MYGAEGFRERAFGVSAMSLRILIVEDEWMIATDVARTLTDAGLDVIGQAGSVRKALDILAKTECDCAVLDANLGGISVEPVAKVLRARDIPVLVLSGYDESSKRRGALAEAPFLSKPYNARRLVAMVKEMT
jgi:DNA-binding response OmpR family regulator